MSASWPTFPNCKATSRDISARLRRQLSGEQQQRVGRAGTTNPEAYRLYLEGRQAWYGRTTNGLKKSIDLFQQVIAADPNYALAYAGLADTYNVIYSYIGTGITFKQASMLADETTRKALELDGSLPEAHSARATFLATTGKWTEAEAEFRRTLDLNPNNATAHYFYGYGLLMPQKRIDQALDEFRTALTLDPLSPIVNVNYAVTLMTAGRYSDALAQFQKTIERDPAFIPPHYYLSQLDAMTGHFDEAISEFQKRAGIAGSFSSDAHGYNKLVQNDPSPIHPATIALSFVLLGDHDKAFNYFDKAYAEGDSDLIQTLRYPAIDPLRADPRYKDLMRRLGLPE